MLRLLILILCMRLHTILASVEGKCATDEFMCANGSCLRMKWRCDGSSDCFDESDEIGCPKTTCADDFFRCDDGKCIPDRWVCDEGHDCDDQSDENPERCANKTCDGFRCQGIDQCIPESWKCDGKKDCHKGDDEKDCSNPCTESEFTCEDKKCIDIRWKCDGHDDCFDGSDEIDCGGCEEGEFVCANGQCINDQWHCDGDSDCKDGSDETNCTMKELMNQTCDSNMFQCATPLNEAKCIANAWRCDGDSDCPDGSDEVDCEGVRTCASDERMCLETKYCVKKDYFCDQQEDCLDGSDELNCNYTITPAPNCEPNQFDCNTDVPKCILDRYKCDGNDDCGNYADEQNCPKSNMCKTNNGGCQHICVPTSTTPGRICECSAGYELVKGSETSCRDINECDIRGTCSQICINRKGSYKCECEEHYVLTDHRYCKADSVEHPELILSDDYDIRRYELSTCHYTLLLDEKQVSGAVAMDFDFRNEMVYWAGAHSEGVLSANLKTNEVKPVLSDQVKTPDGLAVDWVHGNLYISDTGHDHIVVSRLDGSNSKVLLSDDMDEPRALVVDPYHGWMYWTDWGSDPKIEKCGMNGKERKAIVTENIAWPNGLAIDYVDNRLYWVDAKLHHIGSINLDGQDFRLVRKGHRRLGHPFAITVFEDYIYWTDWIDNAVYKMSKFGTGNITTIAVNLKTPFDIRVFHPYRQPQKMNHCGTNYGGCSHLCLPSPQHVTSTTVTKKFECACPTGMVLEDSHNCVSSKQVITPKPVKPDNPNDKGNPNRPQTPRIKPSTSTPEKTDKPETEKPTSSTKKAVTVKPKDEQTTERSQPEVTIKYVEATTEKPKETTEVNHVNGTQLESKDEKSIGHVAGIAVGLILAVVACIVLVIIILVRRYKKKNVKSMNFDNPVYRKTTTDDQLIMDQDASKNERESMQPLNREAEIV